MIIRRARFWRGLGAVVMIGMPLYLALLFLTSAVPGDIFVVGLFSVVAGAFLMAVGDLIELLSKQGGA